MTESDIDPVWSFLRSLPDKVRTDLNRTEKLVAGIHRAVNDHGWTPAQLAAHCSKNLTARNPGGVIQSRLDRIDGPPASDGESPFGPRVHHGCCEGGWIYDDTSDTPRPPTKCPGNRPTEVHA